MGLTQKTRLAGRELKSRICPRCGLPFSWIERRRVGDNTYYYAVHESRLNGARRVRKCYLGPEEYIYVSKMHSKEKLVLRGLVDPGRLPSYLDAVVEYLKENPLDKATALELASTFEELARELRKYAGRR
ncbi:MAG: hypothetical protein GSR85_05905 [Desulfurococcales archaeon]|nr:hypothetical protein [Desulfurococcales archaeon]